MLQIKDKVICVNDDFGIVINSLMKSAQGLTLIFPQKDKTYIVREIFDNNGIIESILLEEIWNPTFMIPVLNIRRELAFKADRFIKPETSVEEYELDEAIQELLEDSLHVY